MALKLFDSVSRNTTADYWPTRYSDKYKQIDRSPSTYVHSRIKPKHNL